MDSSNNLNNDSEVQEVFPKNGHMLNLGIFVISIIMCASSMLFGSTVVFVVPFLGLVSIVLSFAKSSLITLPLGFLELVSPFIVIYLTYWILSIS